MSHLSEVPVPPEAVMNEYARQLAEMTGVNIRQRVIIRELTAQRDHAMAAWEAVAHELNELKRKYEPPEEMGPAPITKLEGRRS